MSRPRCVRGGGFTLVELVVVMLLMAILAAVAVPRLAVQDGTRGLAAARVLARDVTFARETAVASGRRAWVDFTIGTQRYELRLEGTSPPGRASASAIADPAGTGPFVRTLGSGETAGVGLVSASFDGGSAVGFDWLGRPLAMTEALLSADGSVTLTSGHGVSVSAWSGMVRATTP